MQRQRIQQDDDALEYNNGNPDNDDNGTLEDDELGYNDGNLSDNDDGNPYNDG